MQVVAIRDGFYGKLRKAGDEFEVTDPKHVSAKWMAEVGTKRYEDFMNAHEKRGGQSKEIDKITGERMVSGGVAEQLAIALEDNRRLTAEVAELKATIEVMRSETGKAQTKVETVNPSEPEVTKDAAKETTEQGATRIRRREKK